MSQSNDEMLYNNINPYIYNNIPVKKYKSHTLLTEKWKKSMNIIKNYNHNHNQPHCVTRDEIIDETTPNNIQKKLLQHLTMLLEKTQEEVTLLKKKNTNLQKIVLWFEQQVEDLLTEDNQCSVCMSQKKDSAFVTTFGLVVHSLSDGVALGCSLYCKLILTYFLIYLFLCSLFACLIRK